METPLGVIEPIDRRHRDTKFGLLGVPVSFTRFSWLSFPFYLASVLPVALWQEKERTPLRVLWRASHLSHLLHLTNYLHSLGHVLGGKAVGAPMDELIVTATRQVNVYRGDQSGYPTSTHLARAGGGPLMNLVVALLAFVLYRALDKRPGWLGTLAFFNASTGLMALLPLESVDGGAILEHLGHGDKVVRV